VVKHSLYVDKFTRLLYTCLFSWYGLRIMVGGGGVTVVIESAESSPMQCICAHMRWSVT